MYDPAFLSTASCASTITDLDGANGILRYRGYPIEQLAEKSTFLEVAYLLINGELPDKAQQEQWVHDITYHTYIHENIANFMGGFNHDAHPMGMLVSIIGAMSTFYPEAKDIDDPHNRLIQMTRVIAKLPTIAAFTYRHSVGLPREYPVNHLDYTSNFLRMMWNVADPNGEPDPVLAKALDVLFILHADHEQNCSTSTMRLVGSSHSNLFASASAAIGALWGPLHGGANQAVIEMLEEIQSQGLTGKQYLDRVKNDPETRLMGFGHRVYKNYDPRASVLKVMTRNVLEALGQSTPMLDIAMQLEEVALADEYFVKRKLYPNVDFYSGIIYQAIGVPVNMFTVMFALGRMPGWIAQWMEMHADPKARIGRPRQIYTGANIRDYVEMKNR